MSKLIKSIRMTADLIQKIEALAAQEERDFSGMVRKLLSEALAAREGKI